MTGASVNGSLGEELLTLSVLTMDELRAAWIERFGSAPPRLRSRDLLARAFAYRLQAGQHGDMTIAVRRKLAELGRRIAEDRNYTPVVGPDLRPGSTLVREWRGARHEVQVLDRGFSYRGEAVTSLSQAALRITGVKWNGLVFFGLKPRPGARRTAA